MVEISRRGFLGSLIAGTILVGSPTFAALPNRYQELIAAQQDAIAATRLYREAGQNDYGVAVSAHRNSDAFGVNAAFDRVLVVLRTQFSDMSGPAVDYDRARMLVQTQVFGYAHRDWSWEEQQAWNRESDRRHAAGLGGCRIDTLDEDSLRQYEDFIICVAVVRTMLTVHKIPVSLAQGIIL